MYRVVLLAVGLMAVMAQPAKDDMPPCKRIMHGGLDCCKKELHNSKPSDTFKECFMLPKKPPPSCEQEMCIAKKSGLASEDGVVDSKKTAEFIQMAFRATPDLADSIVDNCVYGDISMYGPPEICVLGKNRICVDVEIIKSCDEWKEDGDCSGIKELAEQCIKEL